MSLIPLSPNAVFTASFFFIFFFFNDTATTEIYTLSLHDALPIYGPWTCGVVAHVSQADQHMHRQARLRFARSEEHTSELQSHLNLVCRLLLEKKKIRIIGVSTTREEPVLVLLTLRACKCRLTSLR